MSHLSVFLKSHLSVFIALAVDIVAW